MLALQDHIEASNSNLWQMKDETRKQLDGQLRSRLGAADSRVLVAEHNTDGVVAAICGRVVSSSRYTPARVGIIDQAFVQADHRRTGIASRLLMELCRFFASRGVDDLSLRYVDGNQEAADFWSAVGFAPRIITSGARRETVESCLNRLLAG